MKVPEAFLSSLTRYFQEMEEKGKLSHMDFECLALTIFSSTFGYTFLSASFDQALFEVEKERYIRQSVAAFIRGMQGQG